MNTLTPNQRESLRLINLATLWGLHHVARTLLAIYLREYPETVRTFNASTK